MRNWLRKLRGYANAENGAVTVEVCLWLPFLVGLVGMIFDLSLFLLNQADMWNVASNTSRALAVGEITVSQAQTFANDNSMRGTGYTVDVSTVGQVITVELTIPWDQVSVTYWFMDADAALRTSVSQRLESTT